MRGITLTESGRDFVRQVFVTFGGNTTVLTLFLLSVLYLALKGKKEERYVFVTTAVFLAFTVYNPFAVKYIQGKLGMVNVYYRFFWILPMVLTIVYACTKVVGGKKKCWRRYLTAAALAEGKLSQTRYDSYCAMYDEVKDVKDWQRPKV